MEFLKLVNKFGNPCKDQEAAQASKLEVIAALVEKDWNDVQVYY